MHISLLGTLLLGKRRLINRRVDWLLWVLTTEVAEEFAIRATAQREGFQSNLKAHSAMNATICKAKEQSASAIISLGTHSAEVGSSQENGGDLCGVAAA